MSYRSSFATICGTRPVSYSLVACDAPVSLVSYVVERVETVKSLAMHSSLTKVSASESLGVSPSCSRGRLALSLPIRNCY